MSKKNLPKALGNITLLCCCLVLFYRVSDKTRNYNKCSKDILNFTIKVTNLSSDKKHNL